MEEVTTELDKALTELRAFKNEYLEKQKEIHRLNKKTIIISIIALVISAAGLVLRLTGII